MTDVLRDGDFELVTLRNGTRAVRQLSTGEIMHPSVGPWHEANLLYVEQARLAERLSAPGEPLVVFDVGLGAATNAVAAIAHALELGSGRKRPLHVVSFERDAAPLRLALADPEGFPFLAPYAEPARALLETGRWEGEGVVWTLHFGDFLEALARASTMAELIYYDPFSPESNGELWTRSAFAQLREHCRDDALLMTYSASTRTRASLLLGGFHVGVGAAVGTKRETTVAGGPRTPLDAPLDDRWLQRWRRSTARAPHGEELTAELERAIETHPQFRR